jgi:hypothetical protein
MNDLNIFHCVLLPPEYDLVSARNRWRYHTLSASGRKAIRVVAIDPVQAASLSVEDQLTTYLQVS